MCFSATIGATTEDFARFVHLFKNLYRAFVAFRTVDEILVFALVFTRCAEGDGRDPFVAVVGTELKRARRNPKDLASADRHVSGL